MTVTVYAPGFTVEVIDKPGVPLPPPVVDVARLTVREPSGTAGMAFRKGDVQNAVAADLVGCQAIVKNRWQDGSVKFAVLSWNDQSISYPAPRTITLGNGAAPAGAPVALSGVPPVSVSLAPIGVVNLDTAAAPFRQWLSGPQCSEWHWRVPVGSDPTLVVWFYVRVYASGAVWVRVVVENGYVKVTPQDRKAYHAIVTIGGVVRYEGDLTHYSRTRWTQEFWADGRPIRAPKHDGAHLMATKLFPHYGYTQQSASAFTYDPLQYVSSAWWDGANGQQSKPQLTVVPLTVANQRPDMRPGGYSPSIAIVALWDVLYLLSGREDMFFCSVANACAGGTHIAYRDEATNLPVKWSSRPKLWAQPNDRESMSPPLDIKPWRYDVAHSPSFSYATYLYTGDYYYVETMQMEATHNWAVRNYIDREGARGLYWAWVQARDFAWMFRTLAQTICITPDGDTLADDYRASLNANVQRHLDINVDGTHPTWGKAKNALGGVCFNTASGNGPPYGTGQRYYEAGWQQHYIGAALSHAQDLDLSGVDAAKLDRLMRFSLGHAVGMVTGWPSTFGGSYSVPYIKNPTGANASYPPADASWWAPDWATAYEWDKEYRRFPDQKALPAGAPMLDTSKLTGLDPLTGTDPGLANGYVGSPSFAISSWGKLATALSAAVDKGVPGAAEGWARMTSASNWAANAAHFNDRPLWGVTPR